ncbi:siderophore-interacting protein [Nocardioides sp. LHG3406-4]|uniref:siderophore-interacting protein n=1 Tax=Nocardioides sp. LHG3406-4 TaxID=2804575 RepID=UPI003CEAFDDE
MYARVTARQQLTPSLVRVVLSDGDLAGFTMPAATDAYVNVAIPPPDAPYDDVFDLAEVRERFAKDLWPARRRYTVRAWDADRKELTLDFVVHGDSGVAGPWAARVRPGDVLVFEGPGGGYLPDPAADWHLMVGDESALPAIAASLEILPAGTRALVRLVCDGPAHEVELRSEAEVDLLWLHRAGMPSDEELLVSALRTAAFPEGRVQAFVHGEAAEIREIRKHLLVDRGLARADMSCSPYWRREMTDEDWRQVKRDFVAAMETDVA